MNDYIRTMRALIGHQTLMTVGCGALIEDQEGRILLQKRTDHSLWGIPGGIMEVGETFEETARREVLEETNLKLDDLKLFGVYSGSSGFSEYENGDKVFSVQIIFSTTGHQGQLKQNNESHEVRFFHRDEVPQNLNQHQAPFITDWVQHNSSLPIIK
ncbi:NUDIX hydrolase [Jeotgalibacillus salarius]|uniref:NUDIX domain-containing protein n=1 Tax=Jeotgalibacillus salarius TaxID=546023 RepID=A0A4Y8LIN8_9BACL|nr:NUDIX domain-containing protein [Jeotgalibacillus salarius]TFE02338.1 NUDIX domain-containing protein [Jeotgalibacillus salarius]